MRRSRIAARSFGAGLLLVTAWCVSPATAAKLENTFYAASTTLFFKVSDAALRKLLPAGWELATVPADARGQSDGHVQRHPGLRDR